MKYGYTLVLVVTLLAHSSTRAQWSRTDGPLGGIAYAVASNGSVLLTCIENVGVFRSTNDGASWSFAHSGIPTPSVLTVHADSTRFFAGTSGRGIYLSTDGGSSWTPRNTGMTGAAVYDIEFKGSLMIAATSSGIYLSTNGGTSWVASDSGLTNLNLRSVATKGSLIFCGGLSGSLNVSTDNGATWTPSKNGITTTTGIKALFADDTRLYAGSGNAIYRSTNDGA